jgi:hypothetical protein
MGLKRLGGLSGGLFKIWSDLVKIEFLPDSVVHQFWGNGAKAGPAADAALANFFWTPYPPI